jgi:hypothetical protein
LKTTALESRDLESGIDTASAQFDAALDQAGNELGLQDYYRACVRPLFAMPRVQWPQCCAGGCEPCAQLLVAVAERVHQLLGTTAA